MVSVSLKVEVITPTFMGGGNSSLDGIRTAGIKGMMRWWFRALAGSVIGDDIKRLKKIEGDIFGIAGSDEDTKKSKFKISLSDKNLTFLNKSSYQSEMNGYVYLGIGNVIFKYDDKKFKLNHEKSNPRGEVLINIGSTFNITLSFYPAASDDDINLVVGSFYLATAMGGFGLRARKGFGSWQILEVKNKDKLKINLLDFTKDGIQKNIDILRGILKGKLNHTSPKPASKYPALDNSKFVLEVVSTSYTDYQKLLDKFGRLYRGFRVNAENPQPDTYNKKVPTSDYKYLTQRSPKNYKIRNALFGLNIVYPKSSTLELKIGEKSCRRASPIWFSVKKVNDKLNLHLTLFKSMFIPDNGQIIFAKKKIKSEEKERIKSEGEKLEIEGYEFLEKKFIPYIKNIQSRLK